MQEQVRNGYKTTKVNNPINSWHFRVVSCVDHQSDPNESLNLHFKTWSGDATISQNQRKMILGGGEVNMESSDDLPHNFKRVKTC